MNPLTSRSRRRALVALVAVAAALLPRAAAAHPYLVSAEPAAGATLRTGPEQIQILYTEALDAPYCSVVLVAPDGGEKTLPVSASGTRLTATPPSLQPGTWVVRWTVVGEDGHRVVGDFPFNVGQASANPAAATTASGGVAGYDIASDVSPVELVGRTLLTLLTVLLGGLLLLGFVALPRDPALRAAAGRRLSRLRTAVWALQAALAAGLVVVLIAEYGGGALLSSLTGKLVVLRLLLTLALAPAVLDGGALAAGRPPSRRTGLYGAAVALMLLGSLALSGHALAEDDRTVQLTVLGIHLLAVSLWVGAIAAVIAAGRLSEARRFTPLVAVSVVVMAATGLYNAKVNLRSLAQLGSSTYGRVLDVKVALVVAMVAAGLLATRRLARGHRVRAVEAAVAVLVLTMAGVLAQTPNPVSFPYPSQTNARPAGTSLVSGSNGRHLVPVAVTPGVVGGNRIIAAVDRTDDNDLPVPVDGVESIELTASCSCASGAQRVMLHAVPGGPWFAGDATLSAPGTWTLEVRPRISGALEDAAVETAEVRPAAALDQVLVGVAADLSGPRGETCQDAAIGLQSAAVEANQGAVVGGDTVRMIAVDTRAAGPAAAVDRLRSLGVALLAAPCGDAATTAAVVDAARRASLPVVGVPEELAAAPWAWTTGLPAAGEGTALADQAAAHQTLSVVLLTGHDPHDTREAGTAMARLDALGVPARRLAIDSDAPATLAERVRALNPGSVVLIASAPAALPVIQALGNLQPAWSPISGALAASGLMSNGLASAGGEWIYKGRISFASEVDPGDTPAIAYATRLGEWYGGRRPSFDGVRGYITGWVVNNALRDAGTDRSGRHLASVLRSDFTDFDFGSSYRLRWIDGRGGAGQLAFFTTVFINPLAQLGAAPSTSHAGIFLKAGAYVRLSPYARVQT
ncbi:MAG TPA: copper resistance protein CopC [Candidatus Dormibacteraeota bacterium]|nr:copper resistance protein CopC [Candidatus Dormibacteraeota bacterium]